MGQVTYNNQEIHFNDDFSFKVFPETFVDIPDNTVVYASSFYQENSPDSPVFRPDMTGVTFLNCNLDNCLIPDGNTVIGGSQRKIQVQDDGFDWLLDDNNNPITKL